MRPSSNLAPAQSVLDDKLVDVMQHFHLDAADALVHKYFATVFLEYFFCLKAKPPQDNTSTRIKKHSQRTGQNKLSLPIVIQCIGLERPDENHFLVI